MNANIDFILSKLGNYKIYPSGWYSVNCPCCTYNGEPTPDSKKRGGFYFIDNDSFVYKCFRCKFKMMWNGKRLSQKNKIFLRYIGFSDEEIDNINLNLLKKSDSLQKNNNENIKNNVSNEIISNNNNNYELPEKAESFKKLMGKCQNKFFINALNFLKNRGEYLLNEYEFFWSYTEKYRNGIIIPIYHNNVLKGYGIRYIGNSKAKYIIKKDPNVLFNMDNIFKEKRKYIILVEGFFDAMAINCTGILGNSLNEEKIKLLNSTGKEIIVVPDRDIAGIKIIEIAQREGWYVSFPFKKGIPYTKNNTCFNNWEWEKGIKDVSDAVKLYGRLYVLNSILTSKTRDPLYINLFKKMIEIENKK